ncbi:MAG: c-type cytochrome [Pirellulales bacterium]
MIQTSKHRSLTITLFAAAAVGCGKTERPEFRLNMPEMVTAQIIPQHQQEIADTLAALFGTPDEPFALASTGLDVKKLRIAAGQVAGYEPGVKRGLYRQHCVHCHGINGDGHGPTAMILNPYPRDYRKGVFKFKSTYNPDRPANEDLYAVLHDGIPGTSMPAFALLPPDEIAALIEYVKYLSIRGQTETSLIGLVSQDLEYDPVTGVAAEGPEGKLDPANNADQRAVIDEMIAEIVEGWQAANDQRIVPEQQFQPVDTRSVAQIAESAEKGRVLFYGERANCVKCHGPTALGDGQQNDFDVWMKENVAFREATEKLPESIDTLEKELGELDGEAYEAAEQELSAKQNELIVREQVVETLFPVRNAIPRNMRLGVYRGGRRPVDFFWRIHQGIAGTPMPATGPASPGAQGTLTEEEMWNIVDYIRSVPFEPASRPQLRLVENTEQVN